jgi:large subunit ribosomal protein L44e
MKIPKLIKRYCPHCKKHTEHKVSMAKKKTPGSTHPLGKSAKKRRGFGKGMGNLGTRGSKPPLTGWKMTGKKGSKKTDLRYECKVCKKTHTQREGFRSKKIEFV